eukprot:CAMPEP_0197517182 /NCGR_PEP_ID=MMETSP1318-20131121/2153_1 /TAXON_ID=552666 /ORGANISM="Partenskyella glossopodia, Strain RCC365" /LENGTH=400 /DNA_ID=CAMNT_0043066531 /DNA_START=270 /DNA_END=1472 /DNA_ORIENTATION=+
MAESTSVAKEACVEQKKNKASGFDFYNQLGAPKHVVAPMVNQSELPFRMLCRRYGADLCYTPMIHAGLCCRKKGHIWDVFHTAEGDDPLIAQFCANNTEQFIQSARMIEDQVQGVDLNLGCPQGIARRGHYGAFLLEEFSLLKEMVTTAHLHLNVPVTCKIRKLPKPEDTMALAHLLQNAGCQILTVHGRTRDEINQKIGDCDFGIIRRIKQELKIPVFSNGGIESFGDIDKCLKETGADAVMVSEAILEDPSLFSGKTYDPCDIADEYLQLVDKYPSMKAEFCVRPHLYKMMYKELRYYTDLRDEWCHAPADVLRKGPQEIRERRAKNNSADAKKILAMPTWYRRHRTAAAEKKRREEQKRKKLLVERKKEKEEEEARGDEETLLQRFFDNSSDESEDE